MTVNGDRYSQLDSPSLDPAQQSLADALRFTFRIIQLVIVLLVILFIGSGFQTVGEGERGIKLVFGRVHSSDLPPGTQWNWPFPIGELVKVRTGQQTLDLNESFWPRLTREQRAVSITSLHGSKPTLKPGEDGSLITADGNIVHTEWRVVYQREDPTSWAQNLYETDERRIVRAAVERGVVRVIAETEIDRLLLHDGAEAGFAEGSVELRVRRIAQETLDAVGAGLRIERVTLRSRTPPLRIGREFALVANAEAQASKAREEAEQYARSTLNATAGPAHSVLLDLIDEYERAIALQRHEEADALLTRIDRIFDREAVETEGEALPFVGRARELITDARRYRTEVISTSRSDEATFTAKREQFRANPQVFIASEWQTAWQRFLDVAQPEIFPVGRRSPIIFLNPDPELVREAEARRQREEITTTIETERERRERLQRQHRDAAIPERPRP